MQAIRSRKEKSPNQYAVSPNSSLRLKGLAQARGSLTQASSFRLGESSTNRNSGLCAFSLRRDSPRLSETLARSKLSSSPEWPLVWKGLGESLLISPRRGKLAWARLSAHDCSQLHQPHTNAKQNNLTIQASTTVHNPRIMNPRIVQTTITPDKRVLASLTWK